MADTGQDVVQALPFAPGIVDVVGRHDLDPQLVGQVQQRRVQAHVRGQAVPLQLDPEAVPQMARN